MSGQMNESMEAPSGPPWGLNRPLCDARSAECEPLVREEGLWRLMVTGCGRVVEKVVDAVQVSTGQNIYRVCLRPWDVGLGVSYPRGRAPCVDEWRSSQQMGPLVANVKTQVSILWGNCVTQ